MKIVEFSVFFNKELSRLSRKFPRLLQPVTTLVEQLKQGELPGDKIPNVGFDVYFDYQTLMQSGVNAVVFAPFTTFGKWILLRS